MRPRRKRGSRPPPASITTRRVGAARAAVDRGLLIAGSDGTSYDFRHALLRQAVLDELLPDERVALHYAIAAALTADPAVAVGIDRTAELALALGCGP